MDTTHPSPNELLQFSRRLLASEIMTPASYELLQNDIEAEKINAPAQLIRYCQHARLFNLMNYLDHPEAAIEGIFRDISTIFPELAFTDYLQNELVDPYPNPMFKKMQVTFHANWKTYKTEVHLLFFEMKPNGTYSYAISQQGFCTVFNEMLKDIRSPWRLHEITSPYLNRSSSLYYFLGVIALQKPQTKMFGAITDILIIQGADYRNALTVDQIDAAISAYRKTDLLKNVGAAEIDAARNKAVLSGIQHFSELLAFFPHVMFLYEHYVGDREVNPYTRLLRGYADITRGEFAPIDIVETASAEEDGPTTLRFRWSDKTREQVLQREHSHVSPDFFTLMNRIGSDLPGKFHLLYDAQWRSAMIYLHPEQYAFLAAGGYVVDQLKGIMEEE